MAAVMLLAGGGLLQPQMVHAACDTAANPVVCENQLPGNPGSQWDIQGGVDETLLGFTNDISYTAGQTVTFKVNSPGAYTIDIYRLGWYQGNGARLVGSATITATLPLVQNACMSDPASPPTGLIDCDNWVPTATWAIPAGSVSGVYLAKLTRTGAPTPNQNHIPFIVRDDNSHSDLLFQTSDTTWQAYNNFGGNSLYEGNPVGRAVKVSYNRPWHTNVSKPESWVLADELPMIRYLESNGFNVSYISGIDTDRFGATLLPNHKAFLSVGHDEYWSANQRANVEHARDGASHVNLAFFSGNESFWKTRYENSFVTPSAAYRTLVSYKSTQSPFLHDPMEPAVGTATWRDPRWSTDGARPENSMSGNIFMVNGTDYRSLVVPAAMTSLRFWRNTPIANSSTDQTITAGCGCLLGYEWDAEYDNGSRPAGLVDLSSSTYQVNTLLQDYGVTYTPGAATHHLTLYKAASGAIVFGAGTVNFAAGLDSMHAGTPNSTPDVSLRQAVVNLFADMGAQPATITAGLTAATAGSDTTRPTSTVTSVQAGAHIAGGTDVTISGTANDTGGRVGGVEVSVDNGTTWHPANGTSNWSYSWRVTTTGATTIRSRASDDSANVENPGPGVAVTIDPAACPCSLFRTTDAPAPQGNLDPQSVMVGLRFTSDTDGFITAIRFYKPTGATGTHQVILWSNTGQRLAQGTATSEPASGWTTVPFGSPVAISRNTTYIASYFAPNGGYASTSSAFGQGLDNPPLHAVHDSGDPATGANGIYQYTSAVPVAPSWSTFTASNYWVDVIFNTTANDTTPPTVQGDASTSGATGSPLDATPRATFNEDIRPDTASLTLTDQNSFVLAGQVTYNQGAFTETFTPSGPLALNTNYTATVAGVQDLAGNAMPAPYTFQLHTPACPCSFWDDMALPVTPSQPDAQSVEVGMHFRTHVDGFITSIRFYKGPTNTGTHVGHLWSSNGTLLGTASFSGESATGWQTATLTPAATGSNYVVPNTDYVVSYLAPNGNYAVTPNAFATIDRDIGPLRAPALVTNGTTSIVNGVYVYGPSGGFPVNSTGSNYSVDVVFQPNGGAAPVVGSQQNPVVDQTTAKFTWTTDKLSDSIVGWGPAAPVGGRYANYSLLDTKQVTSHTAQIAGLTPSTTYHYSVISRDSSGGSSAITDRTFTTAAIPDTVPPTITNITRSGSNGSTTQVITWRTSEPADTRLTYGTTTSYGPQSPLLLDQTTPVTTHTVTLTGLDPSTLYHFQIASADVASNLTTQPDDTFTTGDVAIAAVNAQVLNDLTGDTQATISWTSDAPADTVLDYGTTASYGTHVAVPDPVTSHTVPLTGLTPGTTYHFRVQSTANGHTAASTDQTFQTRDHKAPEITAVNAPDGVDFTTETITWTTDEPATTEVDYSTNTSYSNVVTVPGLSTAHSVSLTGLSAGTTYHFVIKSADAAGNGATTTDDTFTTKAQNPPQISLVKAAPTTNTAVITWTTTTASSSQVKYGATASYGSTANGTAGTSHSVTLTGLTPSTTYHYQVVSVDSATSLSASSADMTFTTLSAADTTAPVLSNVKTSMTTTSATITWSTNENSTTQVSYGLTTSYGTDTTLVSTAVMSHSVTLTNLQPNTTYYFKARSKDAAKNEGTATGSFKTLPLPRSLKLDGGNDYVQAPNASEVNVTGDLTVETWFKDTTLDPRSGKPTYNHLPTAILVKGDVVADKDVPYAIGIAFDQLFIAEKTNYSFSYMYYDLSAHNVTPNAWHHLAFSIKASTRQATLYIDGVQVMQGTLSAVTTVGNGKPVTIGRNGAPVGYANWQGNLDDVRIWNVVRSANDVTANYRTEIQSPPASLVGNWKFNEGTGTTAVDSSATPQNATLYNGATWSTDVHN